MKIKKKILIYLILVLTLFIIGGIAYQQVAVKNLPASSDDVQLTSITSNKDTIIEPLPLVEEQRRYDSGMFNFNFPANWFQEDTSPDRGSVEEDIIVKTTVLTNFPQNKSVSAGFPENGVRVDIIIRNLTDEIAKQPLVECGMKAETCKKREINGVQYSESEAVLNTGFIRKELGTDLKKYRINVVFMLSTGTDQQKNKELVEQIINSFITTQN